MAQNIGFVVAIVTVFALGVGLSRRVISELHTVAAELHVRMADLEAAVKSKL